MTHEDCANELIREAVQLLRENVDEDTYLSIALESLPLNYTINVAVEIDGFVRQTDSLNLSAPHPQQESLWSFRQDGFMEPLQIVCPDAIQLARAIRLLLEHV